MRLIDADAFIEDMKDLYRRAGWSFREIHFSLGDTISNIDNMPTIDAVPVRRAHWIYHPDWEEEGECCYECSECGMGSETDFNYCMKCGAKMIGMETAKREEE